MAGLVPAISIIQAQRPQTPALKRRALPIEITGTSPVMTR
jgi:hypothetical protein